MSRMTDDFDALYDAKFGGGAGAAAGAVDDFDALYDAKFGPGPHTDLSGSEFYDMGERGPGVAPPPSTFAGVSEQFAGQATRGPDIVNPMANQPSLGATARNAFIQGIAQNVGGVGRLAQSGVAAAANPLSAGLGAVTAAARIPYTAAQRIGQDVGIGALDRFGGEGLAALDTVDRFRADAPALHMSPVQQAVSQIGGGIANAGQAVDMAMQTQLPESADEPFSAHWFAANLGRMVPGMGAAVGGAAAGALAGGPAGAVAGAFAPSFLLEAGAQASEIYRTRKEQGASDEDALTDAFLPAVGSGAVNAAIETVGGPEAAVASRGAGMARGLARRLLRGAVTEAGEEVAQGTVSDIVSSAATGQQIDPAQFMASRLQEGVLGAVAGGGFGGVVEGGRAVGRRVMQGNKAKPLNPKIVQNIVDIGASLTVEGEVLVADGVVTEAGKRIISQFAPSESNAAQPSPAQPANEPDAVPPSPLTKPDEQVNQPPEDLDSGVSQGVSEVLAGQRVGVVVPRGTSLPIPPGLRRFNMGTENGFVLYDPAKITPKDLRSARMKGTLEEVLGVQVPSQENPVSSEASSTGDLPETHPSGGDVRASSQETPQNQPSLDSQIRRDDQIDAMLAQQALEAQRRSVSQTPTDATVPPFVPEQSARPLTGESLDSSGQSPTLAGSVESAASPETSDGNTAAVGNTFTDSTTDYASMTPAQLSAEAKRRGLRATGSKAAMIRRLEEAEQTRGTTPPVEAPQPTRPGETPSAASDPAEPQSVSAETAVPSPDSTRNGTREPWEMTREEFVKLANQPVRVNIPVANDRVKNGRMSQEELDGLLRQDAQRDEISKLVGAEQRENSSNARAPQDVLAVGGPLEIAAHKRIVSRALSEGRTVPQEVLRDYPDLARTQPTPDHSGDTPPVKETSTPTPEVKGNGPKVEDGGTTKQSLAVDTNSSITSNSSATSPNSPEIPDSSTADKPKPGFKKNAPETVSSSQTDTKLSPDTASGHKDGGNVEPPAPPLRDTPPEDAENLQTGERPAKQPPPTEAPPPDRPRSVSREDADDDTSLTAAKNAWMARDRALFGLDALDGPERRTRIETLNLAKKQGLGEPQQAMRLASEALENGRLLSDIETSGMDIHAVRLKNEHRALKERINKSTDDAETMDIAAQMNRVQQEFDLLTQALKISGTGVGRAMYARRMTIDEDFDIVSVKSRAKASKGTGLSADQSAQFEKMASDLEATVAKVAELEAQMAADRAEHAIKRHKATYRKTAAEREATVTALVEKAKMLAKEGCH